MAAPAAALVVETASRSAGKLNTLNEQEPPVQSGGFSPGRLRSKAAIARAADACHQLPIFYRKINPQLIVLIEDLERKGIEPSTFALRTRRSPN